MNKSAIILFAIAFLFCSCQKFEQLYSRSFGCEVVFGQSTAKRGANTKAEYSGDVNKTTKYERIDWVEGDRIRIFCAQASAPTSHYADYSVTNNTDAPITSSGSSSSAKIIHFGTGTGLQWGEEVDHKFSAICPAPGSGTDSTSVSENTATCYLPAVQTYGELFNSSGNYTATPNTDYLYLVGNAKANPSEENKAVNIYFDPAITTFEFTLQSNYDSGSPMKIASAGITTETGTLIGQYSVNVTNIGSAASQTLSKSDITGTKTWSKTITMNFPEVISVAKGNTITFTLFAQPGNDITKLTFWFYDSFDTSTRVKRSFAFKYSDSSKGTNGWVDFIAFHKSKITGLVAPESVGWTINSLPVVAEWSKEDEDLELDGGNVISIITPAVITWGEVNKGTVTIEDLNE